MARQETVTLIDDIDGGKAHETVAFGLDGSTYEIDLNNKKAAALRCGRSWPSSSPRPGLSGPSRLSVGRTSAVQRPGKPTGPPVNRPLRRSGSGLPQLAWRRSDRGRIAASIQEQYLATRTN